MISVLRHKSKFEFQPFLEKKIKFLGFNAVVLVKTFPLMYKLATNVGLIAIDEAMVISFLGVRTDMVLESSHGNMSAHKNFTSKLKISG